MPTTITQQNPACPECGCKRTIRKGKRRNRLQTSQVFQCAECLHRFTREPGKDKTYPLKIILESISTFKLGYSLTETQRLLRQRSHRNISGAHYQFLVDRIQTAHHLRPPAQCRQKTLQSGDRPTLPYIRSFVHIRHAETLRRLRDDLLYLQRGYRIEEVGH